MAMRWITAAALLVVLVAAMALKGPSGSAAASSTDRVSVDGSGAEGVALSGYPSISADGRFVVFSSDATNLVSDDTNSATDVFVRDRQSGTTERASVDSAGAEGAGISYTPSISADGRYVAFTSTASNLVAGDVNGVNDIFLRDRQTGTTSRVSLDGADAEATDASYEPAVSGDGHFVTFRSAAFNLVPGDVNAVADIFVRDTQAGTTERVSLATAGNASSASSYAPSISDDGRYVAFSSAATNLVPADTNVWSDIFVRDRQAGTTTRVSLSSAGSQVNGHSSDPAISGDGGFVAFRSLASNLVSGDTNGAYDVFLHDRLSGATDLMSADGTGAEGSALSGSPAVSADGSYVAFRSLASNLVSGDTNVAADVFLRHRARGIIVRVSVDAGGGPGERRQRFPGAHRRWAHRVPLGGVQPRFRRHQRGHGYLCSSVGRRGLRRSLGPVR